MSRPSEQHAAAAAELETQSALPISSCEEWRSSATQTSAPAADVSPTPPSSTRYLVIEEIGRGSMGVVRRAYDPRLQREIALKSVRASDTDESGESQLDMLREAQSMAQLSHPNVVAVYDVEMSGSDVVIAMEYVRGTTLKAWLAQRQPWTEVLAMFIAAGRGLAAAHAAGLLHRDFKPANVLVGEDGRARVTDFGLARMQAGVELGATGTFGANAISEVSAFSGTPRYMAPEQHVGQPLDASTDQYAFCVALWEALTGTPPFDASDWVEAAARKLEGPPPWPRNVVVPLAVRRAITRGLAPSPSDRWPAMEALLAALAAARPRRRTWLVTTGVALGCSISGLAWSAHRQQQGERCTGALVQLTGVWDPARREAVRAAFEDAQLAYGRDAWQRAATQLDDYVRAWVSMHTDACEATTVRGEQPLEVMDLRMACLHRAKLDLAAVSDLFARADAQVVEKAHDVLRGLPALERCADLEALRAEVPPPGPHEQDAVEAIRAELAEVGALRQAGKYPDALAQVQQVRDRATAVRYAPVYAETLVELGQAWENAGDWVQAADAYKRALKSAIATKQWQEAAHVATSLVQTVGWQQARPEEALAYAATAAALLRYTDGTLEPVLHSHKGAAFDRLGRYVDGEVEHRAAVSLAIEMWGPDHLEVSIYRGNLASNLMHQGRLSEAESELLAKLSIRKAALGPGHPSLAHAYFDLANIFAQQGRQAEAESYTRRALDIWEKTLSSRHANTALARASLASILAGRGRLREAEAQYRAALPVLREAVGPEHFYVTSMQGEHALTLAYLGHFEESEASMREALAVELRTYGADHVEVAFRRLRLAFVLVSSRKYSEAEAQARAALRFLTETQQESHPERPFAHALLGAAMSGQGRLREGELELRRAAELGERTWGSSSARWSRILSQWGHTLHLQGRHAEAEAAQRRALALQLEQLDGTHYDIAVTRGRLGHALAAQERLDEAVAEYREALAIRRSATGDDHPHAAELEAALAETLGLRARMSRDR